MKESKDTVVLVVDDEIYLRDAIAFELRRKGFKILLAANGREALDLVKKEPVDLIVSDIRMPGGTGTELLSNITALSIPIPVVMLITGFADVSLEEAYDLGASAVVSKPFDRRTILAAVMKGLTPRESAWGGAAEPKPNEHGLKLQFSELDEAVKNHLFRLGQGGMFIAIEDGFPELGTSVGFRVLFERSSIQTLEGTGIVRWVRTEPAHEQRAGCGIEFSTLSDSCRDQVIDMMNRVKPGAFIPRS